MMAGAQSGIDSGVMESKAVMNLLMEFNSHDVMHGDVIFSVGIRRPGYVMESYTPEVTPYEYVSIFSILNSLSIS